MQLKQLASEHFELKISIFKAPLYCKGLLRYGQAKYAFYWESSTTMLGEKIFDKLFHHFQLALSCLVDLYPDTALKSAIKIRSNE